MKTSKVNLQNTIADKAIFGLTIELLFCKNSKRSNTISSELNPDDFAGNVPVTYLLQNHF